VPVFVAIWSIRKAVNNRGSLGPAISGLVGVVTFTAVVGLIIVWPKPHNMVLGGGAQAGSTDARCMQWRAAIPFMESNPISGHGFVQGGSLINSSIDSYVISLLVETGIPGLVFFAGLLLLPIWYGLKNYLSDMSDTGAAAGALACSFVVFTSYRLVLSERENHMLIFSLIAIVVFINYEYARKRATEQRSSESPREAYYPVEGHGLKAVDGISRFTQ
jgi:O-antigen ligase